MGKRPRGARLIHPPNTRSARVHNRKPREKTTRVRLCYRHLSRAEHITLDIAQTTTTTKGRESMKLEHAALNVPEPGAMARWYAENLGLRIVVANDQGTFIHFLSDDGGSMIELYHNPVGEVLDFAAMSPYSLHLAFGTDDIAADHARLLAAGAQPVDEIATTPTGDQLVFLRDPWNVPIQLAQRAKPLA